MKKILITLFAISPLSFQPVLHLTVLDSSTSALLQAISIVDKNTTWISGHQATLIRTTDGGKNWQVFVHESDTLQFRDLHALDSNRVIVMSAGTGDASGIFLFDTKTGWKQTYKMPYKEGFLNSIEFWDDSRGLAFGDSFGGTLFILKTTDGGASWERVSPDQLPAAYPGEGGFAASGTCISTLPGGKAWIGTGAGETARMLYTDNYGETWSANSTPMLSGKMAGIFSTRMVTPKVGAIAGGDLQSKSPYMNNLFWTEDGAKTWTDASRPNIEGTFYGSDILELKKGYLWITCGPGGMNYTVDKGNSWVTLDTLNYWAVDLHSEGFGYAAGTNGKVVKIFLK